MTMPFAALSMFHLASVIFGLAAGIGTLRLMPEIGPARAVFVGLAVLLLGLILAEGVARRRERRFLLQRLHQANASQQQQAAMVQRLQDTVEAMDESRDREDLLSEMRLVRSQLVRLAATKQASRSGPEAVSAVSQQPLTGEPLLNATMSALKENRIDLYVQPVVRLPQRRLAFHECLTRLRDETGAIITPDQYLPIAEEAGHISAIDNLSMFRCVQALKTRRSPDYSELGFFCNLSTSTLEDGEFFDQFAEFLVGNRNLSNRIIFEVDARLLLSAGHMVRTNLDTLARLGFRLSADHIDSLDMDLAELARRGASFLKVDVDPLLGDKDRSAGAVREALNAARVTLIATKVEAEQQVVELVEADIRLAQGYLFGEPRPMIDDASRGQKAA